MENDNEPSEETKNRWHNDPDNWVWGIFYYNPEDPKIIYTKKNQRIWMDNKLCKF